MMKITISNCSLLGTWVEINKILLAKKNGLALTKNQLNRWGLKYHKLIMGNPSYDFFVDDKNLDFKKNWHNLLIKKLK